MASRRPTGTGSARRQTAYDAGRRGEPMPGWALDDQTLIGAWEDGAADREESDLADHDADPPPAAEPESEPPGSPDTGATDKGSAASKPKRTAKPKGLGGRLRGEANKRVDAAGDRLVAGAGGAVEQGAGFLLGVIAYALALNYLRGGPDAARGWLAAKFLNRPYAAPPAAALTPETPARPDFGDVSVAVPGSQSLATVVPLPNRSVTA